MDVNDDSLTDDQIRRYKNELAEAKAQRSSLLAGNIDRLLPRSGSILLGRTASFPLQSRNAARNASAAEPSVPFLSRPHTQEVRRTDIKEVSSFSKELALRQAELRKLCKEHESLKEVVRERSALYSELLVEKISLQGLVHRKQHSEVNTVQVASDDLHQTVQLHDGDGGTHCGRCGPVVEHLAKEISSIQASLATELAMREKIEEINQSLESELKMLKKALKIKVKMVADAPRARLLNRSHRETQTPPASQSAQLGSTALEYGLPSSLHGRVDENRRRGHDQDAVCSAVVVALSDGVVAVNGGDFEAGGVEQVQQDIGRGTAAPVVLSALLPDVAASLVICDSEPVGAPVTAEDVTASTSHEGKGALRKPELQVAQMDAARAAVEEHHDGRPLPPHQALVDSETCLQQRLDDVCLENDSLRELLDHQRGRADALDDQNRTLHSQLESLRANVADVEASVATKRTALQSLRSQVSPLAAALASSAAAAKGMQREILGELHATSNTILEAVQASEASRRRVESEVRDLQRALEAETQLRRELHNRVQELQGNIRVYCRVRPVAQHDGATVVHFPAEKQIVVGDRCFEFDRVYDTASSQADVFADTEPLITSVMDGYNVCIFAYGQTGAGKTYTMEGPEESRGVNYRAVTRLFELAHSRAESVRYTFNISLLEIYQEAVRDLLHAQPNMKHEIRQGASGHYVSDLSCVAVSSADEVFALMQRGLLARSVGHTALNDISSRSHCLLTVRVDGVNVVSGARLSSELHLVDLAGSERISKSDATGERLKEAQSINKSLSALAVVINALTTTPRPKHIPYRNSKLTFLLQHSLGGDSKTLMFVNINPAKRNLSESICSLNFASRVRSVELGPAQRHIEGEQIIKYKKLPKQFDLCLPDMDSSMADALASPDAPPSPAAADVAPTPRPPSTLSQVRSITAPAPPSHNPPSSAAATVVSSTSSRDASRNRLTSPRAVSHPTVPSVPASPASPSLSTLAARGTASRRPSLVSRAPKPRTPQ